MSDALKAKNIYTTHEISRLLQVNPRSVINWIEQRLLVSHRTPGGHRRIRREDLLTFVRHHQMPMPESLVEGKFNVLIVDDEVETVTALKTFLEDRGGYEVKSSSDGITALIEVGRTKPDIIIFNLMMPGIDAPEVCRRIKADRTNKTLIIAVGQAEQEAEILRAGADAFMAKPIDLDKLEAEAKRLLLTVTSTAI